ncbi:MAG: phage tail protein, partial [Acidovorax sp.]|nr:phage tail protein [Acidovorax sp.]
ALSLATDALSRLALPTDAIRQFKTDPSDPLLPWLIWEYGLGELLPYLPEPRQAIAEGILWQRLRGTPAALSTALAWIGMRAEVEQEPPGVHFAEFQLDPGEVLDNDQAIANLIAIARLSAPARSRLSRIYHGWDLRRLVLDESRLGEALLSDHSGVFWRDGQTKLSFGRVRQLANPPPDFVLAPAREAVRFAMARLMDRYLLSFSALGDPGHTPNEEILHSHLFTLANALGVPDPFGMVPERKFCKAMVVLSDSTSFGDINANLPRFVWQEEGRAISLGGGDLLSGTPHRLTRVEVLERCYAVHPASAVVPSLRAWPSRSRGQVGCAAVQGDGQLGQLMLGDTPQPPGQRGSMTRLSASHNRVGQRWIDQQVWPAERWRDLWREPDAPAQTGFLPVRQF